MGKDTTKGRRLMSSDTTANVGRRAVADYLRDAYPDARAKRIARDHNISVRQAERYLAARSLPDGFLFSMAKTHGWDFVRQVFAPICGAAAPSAVAARIQAAEAVARAAHEHAEVLKREAIASLGGAWFGARGTGAGVVEQADGGAGAEGDATGAVTRGASGGRR